MKCATSGQFSSQLSSAHADGWAKVAAEDTGGQSNTSRNPGGEGVGDPPLPFSPGGDCLEACGRGVFQFKVLRSNCVVRFLIWRYASKSNFNENIRCVSLMALTPGGLLCGITGAFRGSGWSLAVGQSLAYAVVMRCVEVWAGGAVQRGVVWRDVV